MAKKRNRASMKWHSMDLHLHTPASSDYQDKDANYLDVLHQADAQGLDIIAFADHNTVAGYRQMRDDIEQLKLLQSLKRILPEEEKRLKEYQRLTEKILVLPGFEFTATFGFHILGIFSPEKPIREIEHLLLALNVPPGELDKGSVTVGASSDVLMAYRLINEAGGLAIAAHANSTNGVAMRGFGFGGQTKIAYTQDSNLHALEVTDLEQRGRRTTANFFSGIKPEYPRRMHCIQGSDAHRLKTDPNKSKNLGIGDRATEVLLEEVSFSALMALFTSNDFARTRPKRRKKDEPAFDFVHSAREEGANIVQDFHGSMTVRGGYLYNIISDVCAFANTNGGTLYIGMSADNKAPVVGIKNASQAIKQLEKEISNRISPPLSCTVDKQKTEGKDIIRILVPRGEDPPYAVDDNKIYLREEADTSLAVRDEIVGLVLRGSGSEKSEISPHEPKPHKQPAAKSTKKRDETTSEEPPKTGVEVVSFNERNGTRYYTVRDLRNGNVVKNVTEKSARKLWHYAIMAYAKMNEQQGDPGVQWKGDLGMIKKYKQGRSSRYDLMQKSGTEKKFFFGVTDDGIHGGWRELIGGEE